MKKPNRQNIIKTLSIGIMLMGCIHIAATFTPLIAGKLALLPDASKGAFTYFSLMCGASLLLGGWVAYALAGNIAVNPLIRKSYILAVAILSIAGVLAVCYMHHNPFAWMIFALTMGLMLANMPRLPE